MSCKRCDSERLIRVYGKCSDCFVANYKGQEYEGYVLDGIGIGGGDDMEFTLCLECGQIQDTFPVKDPNLSGEEDEE